MYRVFVGDLVILLLLSGVVSGLTITQSNFACSSSGNRLSWSWFGGVGNDSNLNSSAGAPALRPPSRQAAVSWQAGGKLYILGGRNASGGFSDFWAFDTTTYRWQLLDANVSDTIGLRQNAFSVSNGSHLFLYGGFNQSGEYTAMNTLYSVPTSSLTPNGEAPWQLVHPSQAVVDAQDILITPMDQLLPNATWFGVTSLDYSPGPRWGGASWMVGDVFYLFGGVFKLMGGPLMADLWRWNVRTNDGWTLIAGSVQPNDPGTASFPSARFSPMFWTVGTDLWMYAGEDVLGMALSDLWKYDTLTGTWSQILPDGIRPNEPSQRRAGTTFQTAGKLWLYGGNLYPGLELDDMYYFDIAQGRWVTVIAPSQNDTLRIPVRGALGAPSDAGAPINTPAARTVASGFSFASGNSADPVFWLFGGSSGPTLYWNDVWLFQCVANATCGSNPFGDSSSIGSCNGTWTVPDVQQNTTNVTITTPVELSGNSTITTAETIVVVSRAVNFSSPDVTVIQLNGCANITFGNLTLDLGNFNGTEITLVNGSCLNYSISGLRVIGSNDSCTKFLGSTLQSSSRLYILIERRFVCHKSKVPLIVGASVGGAFLLAALVFASLLLMRRNNWPRWLWHSSSGENVPRSSQEMKSYNTAAHP